MRLELHEDQIAALGLATGDARVCVITGCPGTGKTTLVRAIVEHFVAREQRVALCAPTGKAALRLAQQTGRSASTIHRLLEPLPAEGGGFRFTRDSSRPLEVDVLVLDEVSMVDVRLAAKVLDALPSHARLILVGDQNQLPAVGPGSVLADLLGSGAVPAVELTRIKRQQPGELILACHEIKQGHAPAIRNRAGDDLFLDERSTQDEIAQAVRSLVCQRLPESLPRLMPSRFPDGVDRLRAIQVITPMRTRGALACEALNEDFQDSLNPAVGTWARIRPGDKVIQTRNDYGRGILNGDIGFVLEDATDLDGRKVHRVAFDPIDPAVPVERVVSIPTGENHLELAYAITCHKAQGSEFPVVVIPIHSSMPPVLLTRTWIYTAISRAKHLCVLVGERSAIARAVGRVGTARRVTSLASMLRERVQVRRAPGVRVSVHSVTVAS